MRYLLIADIHGNFPALTAIADRFPPAQFDRILNCGDSLVYAPFANETLAWLRDHKVLSILGNTDKKVIKLLRGLSFKKPSKEEKRVMYTHCAASLSDDNADFLLSLGIKARVELPDMAGKAGTKGRQLGLFHGSPAAPHDFLFAETAAKTFADLAAAYPFRVIVTGHSHTPYHKPVGATHFINPGSVGRMFDGNPAAGCAILETAPGDHIRVKHFRIPYDVAKTISAIRAEGLPEIYAEMFITGRKLN